MARQDEFRDDDAPTRAVRTDEVTTGSVRNDDASRTQTGADVTSRMVGLRSDDRTEDRTDARTDARTEEPALAQHAATETPIYAETGRVLDEGENVEVDRVSAYPARRPQLRWKTSSAAVFGLVFGVVALFSALTAVLAPLAVLFGLIGFGLGVVGVKMADRVGVTGRGVAIGAIVTSVLGFVLGAAVLIGFAVYANAEGPEGVAEQIDTMWTDMPSGDEVVDAVPGL